MRRLIICLLVSTVVIISCATYKFTPLPGDSITVHRNRGVETPVYQDVTLAISINPKYVESDLALQIVVKNLSSEMLTLFDSDIEVFSSKDMIEWKRLDTYTSEQYYKKEYDEYTAGLVLMAISAGLNAYNAGRGSSSTSGTFYGNTGRGSYSGTFNSTTSYYDPVAAELARQRDQQNIQNYANNSQAWLEFLRNNLFYSIDLQEDQEYSGLVFSRSDNGNYYKIIFSTPYKPVTFIFIREEE